MGSTLLMINPESPGDAYDIPRDKLSSAQAKGLMLAEEWQNDKGEKHYYALADRGKALRDGLSRPPKSKLTSEEALAETIPPMDTSTDPPPDIGVLDRVRQGVQGALGDPGIENLPAAIAGGLPGQAAQGLAQGGSAAARVGSAMMGRAVTAGKRVKKTVGKNTDSMLEELRKLDKKTLYQRALEMYTGSDILSKGRNWLNKTD